MRGSSTEGNLRFKIDYGISPLLVSYAAAVLTWEDWYIMEQNRCTGD